MILGKNQESIMGLNSNGSSEIVAGRPGECAIISEEHSSTETEFSQMELGGCHKPVPSERATAPLEDQAAILK